jgi:hypothetical protein
MKTIRLCTIIMMLLAVLGLSLPVAAQEGGDESQPGLAIYMGTFTYNLRAEAALNAEHVAPVEPGTILTVIEVRDDGWARVEHDGIEGWMKDRLLVHVTEDQIADPADPIPPPTGPYQVGQTYLHWIDESRDELFTENENDHRELVISIWYPADVPEDAERDLYWESLSGPGADAWATLFDLFPYSLTPFGQEFDRLPALKSHAFRDVPIVESDTPFPVLIMSHGLTAWVEYTTHLALELASHGYVVVGINHTFFSGVTTFPDGRIVETQISLDTFTDEDSLDVATTEARDAIFVLDRIESLDAGDEEWMFKGRLDLSRVGIFGHSSGGTTSIMAASMDDRIQATIDLDGTVLMNSFPRIEQPLMLFTPRLEEFPSDGINYTVRIPGAEHPSFSDGVLLYPHIGGITNLRTAEIVRAYVLAFFDEYVKGIEQPLLDGSSEDFPEVDLRINNPG